MNESYHLNNAPIREAIIDIFAEYPKDLDRPAHLILLRSLATQISKLFPEVEEIAEAQIELNLERKHGSFKGSIRGFRSFNNDKTRAVQFRLDGFTVNWLRPYTQWEDLRNLASEMWSSYSQVAKPVKVIRLGLRYINDLGLPTPFESFGEYLVADPIVPDGLPQEVSRFLTQVTIDDEDKASATITQAFEGLIDPSLVNVLLDIQTWIQSDFDPEDPEIWSALDHLRDFKNEIFFKSLTEKAVRLFE